MTDSRFPGKCHWCGVPGHRQAECKKRKDESKSLRSHDPASSTNNQDKPSITCYTCGKPGHTSTTCPEKKNGGKSERKEVHLCDHQLSRSTLETSADVAIPPPPEVDDWETDPDFVNDVTEQEQRWGPGGRHVEAIDMAKLREEVFEADKKAKEKEYGGKFGVQQDRMDKSAVGHDYVGKTEKHVSQKDYAQGFGGKFGVQSDRMDASAVGHEYVGVVEKHASQSDYSKGFGGKFGVETDRMDASAVGHEYVGVVEKHASQSDYSKGFGGKFGVQTDRVDKGFGGKFGVESDRVDASAHGFSTVDKVGTNYERHKPDIGGAKPSSIRAKFENMAKEKEQEALKSVQRIRQERQQMDKSLSEKEKERSAKEEEKCPEESKKVEEEREVTVEEQPPQQKLVSTPEVQTAAHTNLPDVTLVGESREIEKETAKEEVT
ncbi:unnamed protein product [Leptidea sinapis]|uniref:CCHC-type domain-containing protein n=1 Tax=Leptidea sinapis TaxID=189913 RepID=A0A5E4QNL9_9NEOP|nr:unnamed protein product [Leptidea sinapis]